MKVRHKLKLKLQNILNSLMSSPGEDSPATGAMSRRAFLDRYGKPAAVTAAGLLAGGVALKLLSAGQGKPKPPTPTATPDWLKSQQDREAAVGATATAGAGQEVIGSAPGHFPEAAIQRARNAIGILRVVTEDGVMELGTASLVADNQGNTFLLTGAHVLTSSGQLSLDKVVALDFGRPHVDTDWHRIPRSQMRLAVPEGYQPTDISRDVGVAVLQPDAIPQALRGVALPLGSSLGEGQTVHAMAAGFPRQTTYYNHAPGNPMADTPLNANLADVSLSSTTGVLKVEGPVINYGFSGSPVITEHGYVVGVVDESDPTYSDLHANYAASIDRVPSLLAR